MNYINIIKIDITFIEQQLDLFHARFNVSPIIICSEHTLSSLKDYCVVNHYNLYSVTKEQVRMFYGCRVFIDNSLEYGIIDIR